MTTFKDTHVELYHLTIYYMNTY